jgi:purine-nucleoside phosphorylase
MDVFKQIFTVGTLFRQRFGLLHDWKPEKAVGVVLGSGLGDWVDTLEGVKKIPFSAVPGFPKVGADGHAGNFCFATVCGNPVFVMQGRVHSYEGHSPEDVVLGVRVMAKHLGVTHLILTNAAGGIPRNYSPGDLVFLKDQINWNIPSPLVGPNDPRIGPRFPDMSNIYDERWRDQAFNLALGVTTLLHRDGVYVGNRGPAYETPALIDAFERLTGTLAGMSTVTEAEAACHAGIRNILGISCVTNKAAGRGNGILDHQEVQDVAARRKAEFCQILTAIVEAPLP